MGEEFVAFELAKKLKKNGFTIPTGSIVAVYNEEGVFHSLTTAADYDGMYRAYYDFEDFRIGETDMIAPTIEQVMKWLRDDIGVSIQPQICRDGTWDCQITYIHEDDEILKGLFGGSSHWRDGNPTYEAAAIAGIEYAVNHII